MSLFAVDRVKASLLQPGLNFTLAAEVADLTRVYVYDKIANTVDVYFWTHSFDVESRVAGYDANCFSPKASMSNNGNKSNAGERGKVTHVKSESVNSAAGKFLQSTPTMVSSRIRRFACYQFGYTHKQYQNRLSQPQTGTSRKLVTSP